MAPLAVKRDLAILALGAGLGAAVARSCARGRGFASLRSPRNADGESEPYDPPRWLPSSAKTPPHRLRLAQLPTPVHRWAIADTPEDTEIWIKRDDYTGSELSGNKVRKLEFLLAEALRLGCDSVITTGGIQSNHCRATAAAARRLGLEPFILLRTDDTDCDPGFAGNLLVDRLVGAQIRQVRLDDPRTGLELVCAMRTELERVGRKPYAFPSGGSNDIGSWGYVEAARELMEQQAQSPASGVPGRFDRIYFPCGSAGTAAGLALAMHFGGQDGERALASELVALGVDDTPEIFYKKIGDIFQDMGVSDLEAKNMLRIVHCVGAGYATSTEVELRFIQEVATSTGVVLDPVYTGKGALGMMHDLQASPAKRVLFIHTGGMLGTFAKSAEIAALLSAGVVQPFRA